MKFIVVSTFPSGEARVIFASKVHYMPKHIDGAPVLFIDDHQVDWIGKHVCRDERNNILWSIDLGEMDEIKQKAVTSYWSRLR